MKPLLSKIVEAADINSCLVASPLVELRRFTIFSIYSPYPLEGEFTNANNVTEAGALSRVRRLRQSHSIAIVELTPYLLKFVRGKSTLPASRRMPRVTGCETFVVPGASGQDLAADVYRPAQTSNHAAVILLHGGGWAQGDRRAMAPYANHLADAGFTAVAVQYRLSTDAIWPAQLIDVRAAFNWLVGNADQFGIDAKRIAFQGFSAGGQLAMMAASAALADYPLHARPGAVVSLFAPPELHLPPLAAGPNPPRMLLGPEAGEAEARDASPISWISKDFPPTFLLNGTSDPMVTYSDTLALFAQFAALGVPVDLQLFQGQTHEFAELPRMLPAVQASIAAFLDRVMVDPAGYEDDNLRLNKFMNPNFLRMLAPADAAP
jgi:acetyl esterase/lipase